MLLIEGVSENSLQSRDKREDVKSPTVCRHLGEGFWTAVALGDRGRAGRAGGQSTGSSGQATEAS